MTMHCQGSKQTSSANGSQLVLDWNTFHVEANNQWSSFVQDVDGVVGVACRSVRELEDMDFESEKGGGIVEESPAIVEVSATCQSVRLQKGHTSSYQRGKG